MTSSDLKHTFDNKCSRYLYMLKNELLTDCKFLVRRGNDKKLIAAHKLILAFASPVFEKMFYGQIPEKDNSITITDVQPAVFEIMLEFIYTDKLNIETVENARVLYYLANKYMLPVLAEQSNEFLCNNTTANNALSLYNFANLNNLDDLKEKCIEVFISDTKHIVQHRYFVNISMDILMTILDQDILKIRERDLFDALERFATKRVLLENECSQNSENESAKKKLKTKLITEEEIRLAVKKIRFLAMTPEEFGEGPSNSKLLKDNEVLIIFKKLTQPYNNEISLPEGFSNLSTRIRISLPKRNMSMPNTRARAAARAARAARALAKKLNTSND